MRAPVLLLLILLGTGGAVWLLVQDASLVEKEWEDTEVGGPSTRGPGLRGHPGQPRSPAHPTGIPQGINQVAGVVQRGGLPSAGRVEGWWRPALEPPHIAADLLSETPDLRAEPGEDGLFQFDGLAQGVLVLRARGPEKRKTFETVHISDQLEAHAVALHLPSGPHTLALEVAYEDGRPFHGTIHLALQEGPGAGPSSGHGDGLLPRQTDAQGRVTFNGLPPTTAIPTAYLKDVFRHPLAQVKVPHPGVVQLRVERGQRAVMGHVFGLRGEPIVDAKVGVHRRDSKQPRLDAWTRTDADGAFTLIAPAGDISLGAKALGRLSQGIRLDGKTNTAAFRLTPAASVHGRVLDTSGAPIADVPVYWRRGLSRFGSYSGPEFTTSDTNGHYRLGMLKAGDLTIFAFGAGWFSQALPTVDTDKDYNPLALSVVAGASIEHDLVVVPAGRITGVVRDGNGEAVAGAHVRSWECGHSIGFCGNAPLSYDFGFVPPPPTVRTDALGRYEISAALTGIEYVLTARQEGFERGEATARIRTAAPVQADIVMTKSVALPHWTVRVRVLDDASGRALEGVEINGGEKKTDASGWADLEGRVGSALRFPVAAAGYFALYTAVDAPKDVASGRAVATHEVRLRRAAAISGVVLFPDGTPAKLVDVKLGEAYGGRTDYSDPDGSFHFGSLDPEGEPERLHMKFFHDGRRYEAECRVSPGETDLRILLTETEHNPALKPREVRVVGPGDGMIRSARAILYAMEPNEYAGGKLYLASHSSRVKDGILKIEVEYVPFWIEIHNAEGATGAQPGAMLWGPFSATSEVDAELRLPAGRQLGGRVVDAQGAPVSGIGIAITARRTGSMKQITRKARHGKARTDAAGRFVLTGLGDCPYRLTISTPDRWKAPEPIETHAGAVPLEIRLEEMARVTVSVKNARGEPIAGCRVETSIAGGNPFSLPSFGNIPETYADGSITLTGLDRAKRYTLSVSPPWDRKDYLKHRLKDWAPDTNTTVTLRDAAAIEGHVVDLAGRPLRQAKVHLLYAAGGKGPRQRADSEGRFIFPGLEPGQYKVVVRHGPFRTEETVTEIAAPTKGLRLVHDAGARLDVVPPDAPAEGTPYTWRLEQLGPDTKPPRLTGEGKWNGQMSISGLQPEARYTLYVHLDGDQIIYVKDLSGAAGTIRPRLLPARTITGLIRLADGKRLSEGARVTISGPAVLRKALATSDGRFVVTGLPPGAWALKAYAWRQLKQYHVSRTARAGTPTNIVLEPKQD